MTETGGRRCPICGRATEVHYKPFCSARCANIDLSRWLNESYRVPACLDENEEDSASEGEESRAPGVEPNADNSRGSRKPS